MARNLNWFQARELAKQGKKIRLETDKFWFFRQQVLWFKTPDNYVVEWTEFTADYFLSNKWTDEPWVTDSSGEIIIPPDTGSTGTGGTTGDISAGDGADSGSGSTGGTGTVGGGSFGGGGMPPPKGAPGFGGGKVKPPPAHGGEADAAISLTAIIDYGTEEDSDRHCVLGSPPSTVDITVTAHISGGPAGLGSVSLTVDGTTVTSTGFNGYSLTHKFEGVAYSEGGTITADADYDPPGAPTLVSATKDFHMLRLCSTLDSESVSVDSA